MKQVILERPSDFVTVRFVDDDKFYGVGNPKDAVRGFISRTVYGPDGSYQVSLPNGFTKGNSHTFYSYGLYGHLEHKDMKKLSLRDFISHIISNGDNVYEFDTLVECVKWASK